MKVQVTIEMNDNQRLGVGLKETGALVPASREEARSYITELVNGDLMAVEAGIAAGIKLIQNREQSTIDAALRGEAT